MSHTPLIKTSRQGTYSKYRGTVALDDPSNLTLTLIEMRMHKKTLIKALAGSILHPV